MNFIIWTIGWFLATTIEDILYNKYYSNNCDNEFVLAAWKSIKIGVWVMGMIKFW